jgi:hypothetical protein
LNSVVVQALVAAGLLGASLWWYRRSPGGASANAGCALWLAWIVFGILSAGSLVWIGTRGGDGVAAMLFGLLLAWIVCGAGIVLGLRMVKRSSPDFARELLGLTMLLAMGLAMLTAMALLALALSH